MTDTTAGEAIARVGRWIANGMADTSDHTPHRDRLKQDLRTVLALAAQPSAGAQVKYALREDNDGKLQIYSASFNALIAQFSRAVPASEREAIGRLIATPAQPETGDVAALREALEPFAALARFDTALTDKWQGRVPNADGDAVVLWKGGFGLKPPVVTYGHFRNALAALSKPNAQGAHEDGGA